MRKKLLPVLIFLFLLALGVMCVHTPVYAAEDDTWMIYSDFKGGDRDWLLTKTSLSYLRGTNLTDYSYMYYMFHSYQKDVGLPSLNDDNTRTSRSYSTQKARTIEFYWRARDNSNYYDQGIYGWHATSTYTDEDGRLCAAVNYYGSAGGIRTPSSIYTDDGQVARVTILDLDNPYVCKVTISDSITTIKKCSCPYLRWLKGGENVTKIGSQAFSSCARLKVLPEFPNLEQIDWLAFEGCFSLTEVALPDNITKISDSAFGWYDVVLGNYDSFAGTDDDLGLEDVFCDNDKIYGITLYANPDSQTYWTLYCVYGDHSVSSWFNPEDGGFDEAMQLELSEHVAFASMDEFPGVEEDAEPEFHNWGGDIPSDYEGERGEGTLVPIETEDSEPSTEERGIIEYLVGLLATNQITMDLLLILMMSMYGLRAIPDDFIAKFQNDEKAQELIQLNQRRINEAYTIQAESDKAYQEIMAKMVANGKTSLDYLSILVKYVPNAPTYSKIIDATKALSKLSEALANGESIDVALRKAAGTFGTGLLLESTLPPQLKAWDVAVLCLFGGSKAQDCTSIGANAEHLMDLLIDMQKVVEEASTGNIEDAKKAAETIFKELSDAKNCKYGQNLTNFAQIIDMCSVDDIVSIAQGMSDMGISKVLSDIAMSMEDVLVKNNPLAENPIVDAIMERFTDYVSDYYSRT